MSSGLFFLRSKRFCRRMSIRCCLCLLLCCLCLSFLLRHRCTIFVCLRLLPAMKRLHCCSCLGFGNRFVFGSCSIKCFFLFRCCLLLLPVLNSLCLLLLLNLKHMCSLRLLLLWAMIVSMSSLHNSGINKTRSGQELRSLKG